MLQKEKYDMRFAEVTTYFRKLLIRPLQHFDSKKTRLGGILKRAIILYRREGFRKFFTKIIIWWPLAHIVTIRTVYKIDLDKMKFVPEDKGLTIEEVNLCDLDVMNSTNEKEIPPDRYQYLTEIIKSSTSNCYMIKNNSGDVCGYCCLGYGKKSHAKISSKIKGVDIHRNSYIGREYTFRKFRGQGVQTFAIYSCLLILKNKGDKTATTRVAKGNIASERAHGKVGFKKVFIEIHFHLFNRFPNSNFLLIPSSSDKSP